MILDKQLQQKNNTIWHTKKKPNLKHMYVTPHILCF
jgi:hypothetical protein